ncbi:MAG: hypothetical protein ACRDTG_32540 [Pseudonocardiaceae bacterium]
MPSGIGKKAGRHNESRSSRGGFDFGGLGGQVAVGFVSDRDLLETLTRLAAMITMFSKDLVTTTLDQKVSIELTLLLLTTADRVLLGIIQGKDSELSDGNDEGAR